MHSSEIPADPSGAQSLEARLCALLLPPRLRIAKWGSISDALQGVSGIDSATQDVYLDGELPDKWLARISKLFALWRLWRVLGASGFSNRRIYQLREAGGEVYEAVPIAGLPPLARFVRPWGALVLRGGRFALSAWRAGVPSADAVVAEARTGWDSRDGATIYLGSGHVFRLVARNEMLRIPCGAQAITRLERGFNALAHASKLEMRLAVPEAIRRFEISGWLVFAESRVPQSGFDYLNMSTAQHAAVHSQAFDAIIELHSVSRRVIRCTSTEFESLFEGPVARLKAASAMSGLCSQLDVFLRAVHGTFVGRDIALVLAHGDCKIANFLHDGSFNVRGLVDWDRAQIDGLPVVDWVHYCAFDDMLAGRGLITESILLRAQELEFDEDLAEYRARFLVEGFRWRAAAAMTLILHAVEQLEAGNQLAKAEMHAMPGIVARLLEWTLATSPKG